MLTAGVALGVFAYHSLANAGDMGKFMARVGEAFGQPEDAAEWTTHWRANSAGMAMLAAGGIVAGLGLVARKRFAWAALAIALAADAIWLTAIRLRLPRKYPWEPSPTQIVAIALLATMCAWAAWRSRHPKTF